MSKIIDWHINHVWKGGSLAPVPSTCPDDDWTLNSPQKICTRLSKVTLNGDFFKEKDVGHLGPSADP